MQKVKMERISNVYAVPVKRSHSGDSMATQTALVPPLQSRYRSGGQTRGVGKRGAGGSDALCSDGAVVWGRACGEGIDAFVPFDFIDDFEEGAFQAQFICQMVFLQKKMLVAQFFGKSPGGTKPFGE